MTSANRPVLLTGVHGQVGGELLPILRTLVLGDQPVIAPSRESLDLRDADAIRRVVRNVRPRWIINPAAYTAVDKAELEPEAAYLLNRDAVRVLVEEAARIGAPVLHFSTDYVFSGDGDTPWREDDETGPLGVYGASKLAGEQALQSSGAAHLILRTSWVYGTRGKNFLLTILRAAREQEQLRIVNNQFGAPTWSRDLARLVSHIITYCEAQAKETGNTLSETVGALSGIYHASSAGCTTWFGFAAHFLHLAQQAEPEHRFAACIPIPSENHPTPAQRPQNSRLNCDKLVRTFGLTMPTWQDSTMAVMEELTVGSKIRIGSS